MNLQPQGWEIEGLSWRFVTAVISQSLRHNNLKLIFIQNKTEMEIFNVKLMLLILDTINLVLQKLFNHFQVFVIVSL